MKSVLSIAGSDCSGGAGIQADIKTISAHKLYAMTAITALTAQNTRGVFGVVETSPTFVAEQIDAVFEDIVPDAIKIGMVSNPEIIEVICQKLQQYRATNVVVDPVMVATSGSRLMQDGAVRILIEKLLPLAKVITPNLAEAEVLLGRSISQAAEMPDAAAEISRRCSTAVLVKGGHLSDSADDLLWVDGSAHWFRGERIDNPNTHGTGCTLSSAIACGLAQGHGLAESIAAAKAYVRGALRADLNLGHGSGPLNHMYRIVV